MGGMKKTASEGGLYSNFVRRVYLTLCVSVCKIACLVPNVRNYITNQHNPNSN